MDGPVDPDDAGFIPVVVVTEDGRRTSSDRVGSDDGPVTVDIDPLGASVGDLAELTIAAAFAIGSRGARAAAGPVRLAGAMLERAARGPVGRAALRAMTHLLDDPAAEGRQELAMASRLIEARIARVVGVVVPVVVESIDVQLVLDRVDLDDLIARVDIDEALTQVDIEALLARVDIDGLLARVDVDALLDRIDVDQLMARVDIDGLLARVDVDALMERVDVDALMERTQIGDVIARSTGQVADSALDLARRQAVGLDTVLMRVVDRAMGRDPDAGSKGPVALRRDAGEDGT